MTLANILTVWVIVSIFTFCVSVGFLEAIGLSKWCALILFWPVIIALLALRGLREIWRGE